MDGVHPKVHEFLPQNTHLCSKRVSWWMVCTPRCMSFYGKTPIYAPKGQVYRWCAPQGAWVCTAKQPSMHEIGELMDAVQPKVHEFSPQNTHLCTKRAS